MFNIIFCDDNSQYLTWLTKHVHRVCSTVVPHGIDFSIGPAFGSGEEAMKYIAENHVDVLMLDIDMPGLTGFEMAKILCVEYPQIKIVFMSAYDNFVYSSFEYYPFAYLRKSQISKELPTVIKRIVEKMNETERQITLTTTQGIKRVDISSILYVESNRNYCTFHLIHNKEYVCRGTLATFENEVMSYDFFRIHSAFLINLEHVDRILEKGFVLVKKVTLPIAQRRLQEFKKTYMDYIRRCFNT